MIFTKANEVYLVMIYTGIILSSWTHEFMYNEESYSDYERMVIDIISIAFTFYAVILPFILLYLSRSV